MYSQKHKHRKRDTNTCVSVFVSIKEAIYIKVITHLLKQRQKRRGREGKKRVSYSKVLY